MNFSAMVDFLKNFETGKVLQFLNDMNVGELIQNPWFLGSMGVLALLSLVMKWRLLLVTILSVTGLAGLIAYTLARGTQLDNLGNPTLLIFIGGGALLIAIIIYLLFIKSE
jgi:hypothetical protein